MAGRPAVSKRLELAGSSGESRRELVVGASSSRYCHLRAILRYYIFTCRCCCFIAHGSGRKLLRLDVRSLEDRRNALAESRSIRALLTAMRQVSVTAHKSSYGELASCVLVSYRYQNVVSLTVIDSRASPLRSRKQP